MFFFPGRLICVSLGFMQYVEGKQLLFDFDDSIRFLNFCIVMHLLFQEQYKYQNEPNPTSLRCLINFAQPKSSKPTNEEAKLFFEKLSDCLRCKRIQQANQQYNHRMIFRQSLAKQQITVSDKDINYFIHQINPKHNRIEDYQLALSTWNQYASTRKLQTKKANSILTARPKKSPNSLGSNLCQICYDEMARKRNWCRICGNQCCEKCFARLRVIGSEIEPIGFCNKCDKQYMAAVISKEEEQKFALREKAFLKLVEEQQMVESLLKIERHKLTGPQSEGNHKNQLLLKLNQITQLTSANQALKSEIIQTKRKIDWGQQIKGQLKKKLRKTKKHQSHSFTSSLHEEHEGWQPPKADADEYVSAQNLNQSIINSILETEIQPQTKPQFKCTCQIF